MLLKRSLRLINSMSTLARLVSGILDCVVLLLHLPLIDVLHNIYDVYRR